ncbi:hypothetical protein IT6_05015 [Methylacidiphilum caldifontis]|uniref:beta strand repeat-containing protein n=1 Tax=Methylacidiphilum caldifontis TaxID=2795386 RepID=UPI001A8E3126|nr:hypothetical protein [Methylacidiphilum caldifontis]QSR89627.1 hypothetical protein IT6_05015 [Methylacidiphilum caldifontis]
MKRKFLKKLYKALLILAAGLWIGVGAKSWAVPGAGQLPGNGTIVAGTAHYTTMTPPPGYSNAATLSVIGPTAILWGSSGGTLNVTGSGPGFNVGSSAYLSIGGNSVLNVDTTGSPSYIMGAIHTFSATPVYVANGSGVIVGPNASITAAGGLGLLGYNLSSQASTFNGTVSVAPTTVGSFVNVESGASITASGAHYASILIAAPSVNVGIATSGSLVTSSSGTVNIISGYAFSGYYAFANTFVTSPSVITNSTSGATAGSITISGPASGSFVFPAGSFLLSSGNITTNGNLVLPGGSDIQWGLGYGSMGMWQGWLYNLGTISFSQALSPQTVSYHGSLSNSGTILGNPAATLPGIVIWVTGSIVNHSGAVMNGGNTNVDLWAQQGALINKGIMSGYDFVNLFAQNPGRLNTQYPLGSVYNSGQINITSPTASTDSFTNPGNLAISLFAPLYPHQLTGIPNINIWASSATGDVFFVGGALNIADPHGLHAVALSSAAAPLSTFFLDMPIISQVVSFKGGNLTGDGVLTTEKFNLTTVGDVRNVVSPTNALLNGFNIANGHFGSTDITIDVTSALAPHVINLAVNGNAVINSDHNSTFINKSFIPTGLANAEPYSGGNLLVNATGNLTVGGSTPIDHALSTDILHLGPSFIFPGGVALKAGGTLTVNVPIDNGYTAVAGPNLQGIFLSAPQIIVNAPFVTDGNTLVHTSIPVSATVYAATESPLFPGVYNAVIKPTALVTSPFPWQ